MFSEHPKQSSGMGHQGDIQQISGCLRPVFRDVCTRLPITEGVSVVNLELPEEKKCAEEGVGLPRNWLLGAV